MAKDKYVKKEISNEDLKKFSDVMSNIEGHYMSFLITSEKEGDKDWKATGNIKIGSTLDGEHWGEIEASVMGYDVNSDSAVATVMVALNNYINSPEFVAEMGERITKSLESEPQLPKVLEAK